MHVLFIGGTGLISTAISRQLLAAGHEVTLYNRGKSENRVPAGAKEIRGDRKDYAAFEKEFSDKNYDIVVDMVAFHPDDTASAIRAFSGRCGQFVHCSTVCVYSGPVSTIPTPETETYHSIGGYGKNKIACENLLWEAQSENKLSVTIMRPSHSYGEGGQLVRPFGQGNTLLDRLRKGKPVIVPGDGNGVWAACHVDDVAKGFIGVMGNAKCYGQAYNIAGDEYMTWNMYHEQIAEVAGGTFHPVHIPTDTLYLIAPSLAGGAQEIFEWPSIFDNSKIKRDTNYSGQTISWREGIRRNIAWLEGKGMQTESGSDDYEDRLIAAWEGTTKSLPKP